ncbi:hypothetical protein AQUCO_00600378v1 [Aquilegia coerulea]|uniref:Glycosyltransferase n=1 Tax=Aquilegia coerulea TaxID=218851 RepID=A0A2G5EPF0_AQUCA|nr:hypothetical protein AQUCO_00600378v1 [Aquilegia coerulea]
MSLPNTNTHILVFPYPAQGHMIALLDLAHQLSLQGITITILITPKNLPILQPLLTKNPLIQTLILPFPSHHPSIPDGVENVKDIGNKGNIGIINALVQLSDPITQWFKSHPDPPIAIISDLFLGSTQQLATQLGIPRIMFSSVGAFLVCVLTYLIQHVHELYPLDEVSFPHLPKSPVITRAHLPSVFLRYREGDPLSETVKDGFIANTSSWGTIFNTFDDVEGVYLESFKKVVVGHERVWAVGPIELLGCSNGPAATDRGGVSSVSAVDVLSWLDQCSDASSVVYVCFGSQVLLTRGQMEALAKGLEESGVQFIIVVKSETFIPEGFEDRVAGRGFVIKGWAPQVSILSHRAVGGFLTHCGWNSVLEGIVAGVMLFAWPMEADQFINARLLVHDMGVAVKVCEGVDTVPDSAELACFLRESMSEKGVEKVRAMELRDKAFGAVKEGGSSMNDLNSLVKELRALSVQKA